MNSIQPFRWLKPAATALALAGALATLQAQPYANYVADQFDTDTTSAFNNNGWGAASPVFTWDATLNAITTEATNTPGSGSAEWQITWPNASGDQVMVTRSFAGGTVLNLNDFTNVSFDIMFATNCGTDGQASYGDVIFCVTPQADGWPSTALGEYDSLVANGNGWIHVSIPFTASSQADLDAVTAYGFKIQQSRTGGNLTNTTFYLDNVIFGGNTNFVPAPKLAIAPNTSPAGLMIVCGGSGGTWTRGLMMAYDSANGTRNFSWVGVGAPVTYSQTIVAYPDTNHPIQSAIFLVQNGNFGDPGVDYDAADVAQLSIYGNSDGTATGSFQYKTNQVDGNSQFSANTLATLTAPSPRGTWSITFPNDTNVILSYAPLTGGTELSVTNSFPDENTVQTYFANPLTVFMGNQQNADANLGQSSTYSEFKISGVTASPAIDEVWSSQSSLDTTNWGKVDDAPADILLVHATDKYWLNWPINASGYSLEWTTNLAATNAWTDASISQTVTTTLTNNVLLPSLVASFPAWAPNLFFNLVKRTATQLQVLFPGETNAPGTSTGKVGTPAPVNAGDLVTVTVNAVDNAFHIAKANTDTVQFTTTDTATTPPNNTALTGGTCQVSFYFYTTGTVTVTASDVTTNRVASGTSSPLTVN
jgi:hypothetical protein